MELKKLIRVTIFIIVISCAYSAQYLKNSYFFDETCRISYPSQQECSRTVLPDESWSALSRKTYLPTTFLIANAKSFKQTAPEMHAIHLISKNAADYEPICITQKIPKLPPGKYELSFTSFEKLGQLSYYESTTSFIQLQNQSKLSIGYNRLFYPGRQFQIKDSIQVRQFYTNINLVICVNEYFKTTQPVFRSVRNVSFVRLNDNCDPSVASSQLLMDGTYGCVPHDVVMKGINCDKFIKTTVKNVQTYECGYCDPFGTTPNLVIFSGTYKACAQVKVPGAVGYEVVENKTDISFKKILTPICDKIYKTKAKLAIPKHEILENLKDETSSPCRNDFGAVTLWEVINGKYVAATCQENFVLIDLVNSTETKGCIDPTQKNFDYNCVAYTYNQTSHEFTCKTCNSNYALYPVKIGFQNSITLTCLLISRQVIEFCEVYTFDGDIWTYTYRCAPDGCTKGTIPTSNFMKCGDSIRSCRYLDNFDQSRCAECIQPYILVNGQCTCLPSKLRNDRCQSI